MNNKLIFLLIAVAIIFVFKDKIFGEQSEDSSEGEKVIEKPKTRQEIKKEKMSVLKATGGRGYEGYEPLTERFRKSDLSGWKNNLGGSHTFIPLS